jgi:filamentous hemagglutinin
MNGIQANKNGSFGITLRAAGAVSISNSSASFNSSGIGLSIVNNSSPIMGNITLSNLALNNNNSGLNLITTGSVTMDGVFANGNANFNASIGNASSPIAGIKPISIQNSSFNASSAGYGLIVMSTAPITLNHVLANNNFTFGASVGNCNGAPCTGLGAVSISGASEFSGNKSYGLNILGAGTITLNSVSANQNGTTGISADNSNGTGNVSLSSINTNLNTTQGLSVTTKGAITLTTVTANTNGGNGATLNAPNGTSITVNHGFFNDNGLIGLSSYSKGNQVLNHIVASGNQSMGARIDTCISGTPCTGTGSVTIGNAGGISQFDSNGSTGLTVDSGGKVTMTGFSASNNKAGSGIYITNDKGTGDVVLQTLNASNNSLYGISVSSKGAITLNKTTASSNQGVGVSLNNTAALTSPFPAVTVTNLIANQNSGHNIYITSDGGITLNHVSANGSLTSSGATLINSSGSLTSSINILSTMGSNHFDGNASYGLSIGTSGVTTIKNISAVGNGIVSEADGLRISTTNNVTSIYCSLITGNGKSGIRVTQPATGTVTMTGVSYFGNDLFGGGFDDDLYTNLGSVNAVWTPCTNW